MQADVILKEPSSWVPPLSLSGGARVEGGGRARPHPLYAPELGCLCGVFPTIKVILAGLPQWNMKEELNISASLFKMEISA